MGKTKRRGRRGKEKEESRRLEDKPPQAALDHLVAFPNFPARFHCDVGVDEGADLHYHSHVGDRLQVQDAPLWRPASELPRAFLRQ
eukprot:1232318-Pyramimonas_sp.AAC.1